MSPTAKRTVATRLGAGAASLLLWVLVALGALMLVLGILARPGKDGISRIFGHPVLTVLSGSMTPTFRPGDLVVDNPLSADQTRRLAPGDVITFHVSGSSTELITHRIVAVRPKPDNRVAYQTKGDANNVADAELVAPSQIVATYSKKVPFAGYVLRAVRTKSVFFAVVLLPFVYIAAGALLKRRRQGQAADTDLTISAPTEERGSTEVVPVGAIQQH